MSGDYSRRRFDPRRQYAGVHMQQGRVQLDADWNELVDIVERRVRVGTLDTIGRAAVPRETPNAFRIVTSPSGHTIGRGRMYVDGIVAENFGGSQASEFDPVTAEERLLPGSIPFVEQPFFVPSMDIGVPDVPYAVYLDVWRREVTAVEAPSLVEPALGVDTTTRMQTVWQVRTMPVAAGLTKDTIAGSDAWKEATAPSAARLTTKSDPITASTPDPCALVTGGGGYTGLENQLYRVEIHDGGNPGESSFKWSRDNASVAWRVLAIDGATVTLEATGRDSNLRISAGDWVEITEDRHELNGSAGDFQLVVDVDDDKGTVTLQNAPTGVLATRNARVRRWDGPLQTVRDDGAFVDLEQGIRVSFWLDEAIEFGRYKAGEYWLFAARTSDASVEPLDVAPPVGPHHHYACLAIGTGAPGSPDDCRTLWPPEASGAGTGGGCCTVVCEPGDDIQTAIDSLPPEGGCVCLKAGIHELDDVLIITGSNIRIHGESPAAVLRAPTDFAMTVAGANGVIQNITIDRLTIEGMRTAGVERPLIWLAHVEGAVVRDCMLSKPRPDPDLRSIGVFVQGCSDVRIENNRFSGLSLSVWGKGAAGMSITANAITGLPGWSFGVCGTDGEEEAAWTVERNSISECLTGVYLDRSLAEARVIDNVIDRTTAMQLPAGTEDPGPSAFAIEVDGDACRIEGNRLGLRLDRHSGISVSGDFARVSGNSIRGMKVASGDATALGIHVGSIRSWADRETPELITLSEGLVMATMSGGTSAHHVRIENNDLVGVMTGITVFSYVPSRDVSIAGNRILPYGNATSGPRGIDLINCAGATVCGNVVRGAERPLNASDCGTIVVTGSTFHGVSEAVLINLDECQRVIFSSNRCEHEGGVRKGGVATVRIDAPDVTCHGNHISVDSDIRAFLFSAEDGRVAAAGNITDTDWHLADGITLRPAERNDANIIS